jgi:hypothetical protein
MSISRSKLLSLALVLVGLAVMGAGVASAQDVYKVNYFDNNGASFSIGVFGFLAPDAKVRIDNPGLTYGNLCAMIYVFAPDQQLSECCGCIETHNGLRRLSVGRDLTSNSLTAVHLASGVIKIVSAAVNNGAGCDPTANVSPKANLRVWVTHVQDLSSSGTVGLSAVAPVTETLSFPVTETESSDSTLGATELANLQAQCSFVNILGSGAGHCTCGVGD